MAVIKAVSSKAGIGQALDYVAKEEKTDEKLVSGLHCEPETVEEEMQATKELWGKTGGRTYKHFVQSYHADEQITPEQAHRNSLELAENTEAWKGFEVLVATHKDKDHIHTHFIVNSVSFEDGHKLQWSSADLRDLKDRCNEQSRQQGLHVPEKGMTFSGEEREETVAWEKETYQLLKQAEKGEVKSYVQDIALAVMDCRETATSRADFVERMNECGYGVEWSDQRKYITFIDLARQEQGEKKCKIRNKKLEKYYNIDFGKEKSMHAERQSEKTQNSTQENSLIRQLSQKIESLQKEREQDSSLILQQSQKISELQKELQNVPKLHEKIAKLNERLETQSNSDLQKEKEKLERKLDNAKTDAAHWERVAREEFEKNKAITRKVSELNLTLTETEYNIKRKKLQCKSLYAAVSSYLAFLGILNCKAILSSLNAFTAQIQANKAVFGAIALIVAVITYLMIYNQQQNQKRQKKQNYDIAVNRVNTIFLVALGALTASYDYLTKFPYPAYLIFLFVVYQAVKTVVKSKFVY